jgi:hypothetical protein
MSVPIWIDCEGSGCLVHRPGRLWGMCAMCGNNLTPHTNGIADKHQRQDVLAMIARDLSVPSEETTP